MWYMEYGLVVCMLHPYIGMISNNMHIFEGGSNHQPDNIQYSKPHLNTEKMET